MVKPHLPDIRPNREQNFPDSIIMELLILKNDARTDDLIAAANATGLTIDLLELLTQGLSRQAFRKVIGNASSMPSYMKSSDSAYLLRIASAPSSESR